MFRRPHYHSLLSVTSLFTSRRLLSTSPSTTPAPYVKEIKKIGRTYTPTHIRWGDWKCEMCEYTVPAHKQERCVVCKTWNPKPLLKWRCADPECKRVNRGFLLFCQGSTKKPSCKARQPDVEEKWFEAALKLRERRRADPLFGVKGLSKGLWRDNKKARHQFWRDNKDKEAPAV